VLITNVQTDTTSVFTEQSILNSTEGKNVTKYQYRNNLTLAGVFNECLSFGTEVGVTSLCRCDKQLAFVQGFLKHYTKNVASLICGERLLLTETIRNHHAHSRLNDSGVEEGFKN